MPKWAKILIGLIAVIVVIVIAFIIYVNTAFISKEEVRENLIEHINVEEKDIYFENIDLEMDNSQYEVDFYYNNQEYEAKIDAKEGKVIYTDFPMTTNDTTTNNSASQAETSEITLEEAKEIALQHANLNESDLTLVREQEEQDDGTTYYEIEWRDTTYEYDFEISKTGEVLQYDRDRIHD